MREHVGWKYGWKRVGDGEDNNITFCVYPGGKGAAGHIGGRVKGTHMGLIKECGKG